MERKELPGAPGGEREHAAPGVMVGALRSEDALSGWEAAPTALALRLLHGVTSAGTASTEEWVLPANWP